LKRLRESARKSGTVAVALLNRPGAVQLGQLRGQQLQRLHLGLRLQRLDLDGALRLLDLLIGGV